MPNGTHQLYNRQFHDLFRNDIRLTLPSVEIRKPNRYKNISQVILSDFLWRIQITTYKNFGLDLPEFFIIFLKKSTKDEKLNFYDFSNSGQKI